MVQFASYLRRVLCKTRLIFPRINGPIICLDNSVKYLITAIKTNENFIPFSNSVTFRKPRGTDLVTASELIPGFYRSKSNVPAPGSLRTIKSPTEGQSQASNPLPLPALPPHGIYIDRCITYFFSRIVKKQTPDKASLYFFDIFFLRVRFIEVG